MLCVSCLCLVLLCVVDCWAACCVSCFVSCDLLLIGVCVCPVFVGVYAHVVVVYACLCCIVMYRLSVCYVSDCSVSCVFAVCVRCGRVIVFVAVFMCVCDV